MSFIIENKKYFPVFVTKIFFYASYIVQTNKNKIDMKKIILTLFSLFITVVSSFAQDFDEIYKKYEDVKGVERIKISSELLKGTAKILAGVAELSSELAEDQKEGIKLLESIDELQLITTDSKSIDFHAALKDSKFFKKNNYKPLMETSDKHQDVWIYSKDNKKDFISDVILVIKEKSDTDRLLAYIKGEIKPENISRLIVLAKERSKK